MSDIIAVLIVAALVGVVVWIVFVLIAKMLGRLQPRPSRVQATADRADAAYRSDHLEEARTLAEEALRSPQDLHPHSVRRMHFVLAAVAGRRKEWKEYLRRGEALLDLGGPGEVNVRYHYAGVGLRTGDMEAARRHAEKILTVGSDGGDQGLGMLLLGLVAAVEERADDARACLEEARTKFSSAGDTERAACAEAILATIPLEDVLAGEAFELARLAVDKLSHWRGLIPLARARVARRQGRFADARSLYAEAMETSPEGTDAVACSLGLLEASAYLGDLEAVAYWAKEAETAARSLGTGHEALIPMIHGVLAEAEDRMADARRHYEDALALARAADPAELVHVLTGRIAQIAADSGDLVEARQLAATLPQDCGPEDDSRWAAEAQSVLAEVDVSEGDPASARAHLDVSLAFARASRDRVLEAGELVTLGLVEVAQGRYDAAADCADRARPLATLPLMRRRLARLLRALADLDRAAGRSEAAARRIAEADERLRGN